MRGWLGWGVRRWAEASEARACRPQLVGRLWVLGALRAPGPAAYWCTNTAPSALSLPTLDSYFVSLQASRRLGFTSLQLQASLGRMLLGLSAAAAAADACTARLCAALLPHHINTSALFLPFSYPSRYRSSCTSASP